MRLMTEKKSRERVVAEITVAHLAEFAAEIGRALNHDEAVAFLNGEGRAYEMWKHMMLASEEYVKSALRETSRFAARTTTNAEPRRLVV
jgi:hypothetical protein